MCDRLRVSDDINRIEYRDTELYLVPERSYTEHRLYTVGEYEPHVATAIEDNLTVGDIAFDIGAHVGHHTIAMRRAVGRTGDVLAFEPSPSRATVLRRTVSQINGVELRETAISDTKAERSLVEQGAPFITNSSDTESSHVRVPTTTVDAVVEGVEAQKIGLVKMDIEGHEVKALQGMQATLERIGTLIVEIHPYLIYEYYDATEISRMIDTLRHFEWSRINSPKGSHEVRSLSDLLDGNKPVHILCEQSG